MIMRVSLRSNLIIGVIMMGLLVGASAQSSDDTPDATLTQLLDATELHYLAPDEGGVATVLFEGDTLATIELRIGIVGQGPFQSVWVVGQVLRVDDPREWPAAVFPWLLRQNAELLRGNFALDNTGKRVLYLDRLSVAGLEGTTLRASIEFAALVIDISCSELEIYLDQG